jgi:amidohydrolase
VSGAIREPDGAAVDDASWRGLLAAIDAEAAQAIALARWMAAHPELSLQERETASRYVSFLAARGFEVERGSAGLETAFIARRGAESAAARVALLAEMDALPEIGHACGHNLSGPASLLAASALARLTTPDELEIRVVGCPAEELGLGKPRLVAAGAFAGVDAAMMAHASDMRRAHRLFLGIRKFEFVYRGRAAHAAAYPQEGINALDGVIACFVAIGLLRQQLPAAARVHGIVSDGGQAPNIIPERAAARIWVRALDQLVLDDAALRVQACARGAALSSGTQLEITEALGSSPAMRANLPLADLYRDQLVRLGLAESGDAPDANIGSSDITHVSRVVPTIHPNFPIGRELKLHTRRFADACASERGEQGMLEGARALAGTALTLARSSSARERVKKASLSEEMLEVPRTSP